MPTPLSTPLPTSTPILSPTPGSVVSGWAGWDQISSIYYNPQQDDPDNKFLAQAASELKTSLGLVANRVFAVETTTLPATGIYLQVNASLPEFAGKNDEAFKLFADLTGVYVTGKTPIAVREGAYTLLDKLGYRWFFKSPIWKVQPASLVSLAGLNEVQSPAYIYRRIWHPVSVDDNVFVDWKEWNRLDGAQDFDVQHSYSNILSPTDPSAPAAVFCPSATDRRQLNPDNSYVIDKAKQFAGSYFAVGKTRPWDRNDILPAASVPISPNDGRGWCWGDVNGETQTQLITDKVFGLTNTVAKNIQANYPGKYAGIYSYSVYSDVPAIADLSHVFVQVATAFDVTKLNDLQRIQGYKAKGALVGVREYIEPWAWFNDLPNGKTPVKLDQIKTYAANGVTVYNGEGSDSWGVYGPLMYAASKLFWDPSLDYNAIFNDFYAKAFGPAQAPMQKYYTRWIQGQPLSQRTLALAFNDLNQAEQLAAANPQVIDRVRFVEYYMRYAWKWSGYEKGTLSLQDKKDLYAFLYRIQNLYVVFSRYPQKTLLNDLLTNGVTSAEIASLQNTTLPSVTEARTWLNEALSTFAGVPLVEADVVNLTGLSLAPLGNTSLPRLSPANWHGSTVIVQATAGDSIQVNATTPSPYDAGIYSWSGPDGVLLKQVTLLPSRAWQSMTFTAPLTGRYTLTGDGSIDVVGHPAGALPGKTRGDFYIYVPANTKGIAVGVDASVAAIKLHDPSGNLVVDGVPGQMEWAVPNPAPGVWKLSFLPGFSTSIPSFYLLGIAPLAWHDAQYLLVPAPRCLE